MVARHHQHALAPKAELLGETFDEQEDVVKLLLHPPLGKVASERDQIGSDPVVAPQLGQILAEAVKERIEDLVRAAEPQPAEAVVAAELHIGHLQDGERRLRPSGGAGGIVFHHDDEATTAGPGRRTRCLPVVGRLSAGCRPVV